ncbi:hypothetical protein EVG20_g1980 [Dentipellis fragilis]|uniref:F-box domain-containing protein n=1 Tax=Dentipellis fragilis TaxID=205917 RepID=A0A4Y9ZA34_9AGAM|nr:hypothetical protein EVG20_g1980 [Dentipellis fragilis]
MHSLTHRDRVHPTPYQITLTHVSRRWRAVATQTPDLWTFLYISHTHKRLERLDAFLTRSASRPLDIVIRWCPFGSPADLINPPKPRVTNAKRDAELFGAFFVKLIPRVSRWAVFDFGSDAWRLMYTALTMLHSTSAPRLRSLLLRYYDVMDPVENTDPAWPAHSAFAPFGGGPLELQELIVRAVPLDWPRCVFAGLKSLTLGKNARSVGGPANEALRILERSPDLVSLRLEDEVIPNDPVVPVELHALEDLCVAHCNWDQTEWLPDRIVAPNLRALTLLPIAPLRSRVVDALMSVHATTGTSLLKPLRAFRTVPFGDELHSEQLNAFYEELHNIRVLVLDTNAYTTTDHVKLMFDLIYCPTGARHHLPNLTTMVVSLMDWAIMEILVKSRKNAGIPLKKIICSTTCVDSDRAHPFARDLEAFGTVEWPSAECPWECTLTDWLVFDAAVPGTREFEDACAQVKCHLH